MSQSPKERMPEEDDTTEAPLTMAASVVLTNLPKDTSKALETAGSLAVQKGILDCFPIHPYYRTGIHQRYHPLRNSPSPSHPIPPHLHFSFLSSPQLHATNQPPSFLTVTIRLQPIGSAPHLTQRIFKLGTNSTFATIVRFLRRRLGIKEHESVFCYVGSVFSPGLDEGVGNLWSCFRQGEELVVGYAISPAFG